MQRFRTRSRLRSFYSDSVIRSLNPILWYDPSDWSTLFQDSAGTIPVTAVNDPVGLILDKSGNGYHASQSTAINRPTLSQDSNGKYRLLCNGTNSRMSTAAIDLSSTNKLTIVAGVSKVSDAAVGTIVEFSAAGDANNGAFLLRSSDGVAANYRFQARGTAVFGSPFTVAAPDTSVIAATVTLAATGTLVVRRDSVQQSSTTPAFGAVNFGNYSLYIGARSGGSIHFNGGLYGLIIRSVISTASEIEAAEQYMNFKSASY